LKNHPYSPLQESLIWERRGRNGLVLQIYEKREV